MEKQKPKRETEKTWTNLNKFYQSARADGLIKNSRPKDWHYKIYWQQWIDTLADLTPAQRCLWVTLKLCERGNDNAWPAKSWLANKLGVSIRTIRIHCKVLQDKKLVTEQQRPGKSTLFFLKKI